MLVLNAISNMSCNQDIFSSSTSSRRTPVASAATNTTDLVKDDIWRVADKKWCKPMLSQLHTIRQLMIKLPYQSGMCNPL